MQLHKPVRFSTGPFTEYTHWKQTVFYLRQPLTICEGERIKGRITVKPNEKVSGDNKTWYWYTGKIQQYRSSRAISKQPLRTLA